MKFLKKPIIFNNSRVPTWLSKVAPIQIHAITIGPLIFCRGVISEKTKRHETIHCLQYYETFYIGFLLVYLYDFLWAAIIKKKGFSRDAYLAIRFEQEAHHCDDYATYTETREPFAWLDYPLGGED